MELLKQKAEQLRRDTFRTICEGGGGHIPASLSIIEILVVLYYKVMNINPQNPSEPNRDRFILSKGHACVALYTVLADKGFFDSSHLRTYRKPGTILGGHPDMHKVPGVEASTGALGHGFPFGVGMAFAGKLNSKTYRVFTLLGDGECQEGSVWEAAMFASHHMLDNIVAIVDYNKLQAMDRLDKIVSMEPFADKWRAFGWEVREVDGHDITAMIGVFEKLPFAKGKPNMILSNTIKGKDVSFMENVPIWHYRMPNDEEMKKACEDLGMDYIR